MIRSSVWRFSQKASSAAASAATGASVKGAQRKRAAVLITAAAVGAGSVFALTRRPNDWDEYALPHDVSPQQFWSPPTRSQMIEALKQSSSRILRADGSLEQAKSLLMPSHEAVGHSPIPEVEHAYADVPEPVSYTHLTLPTICSV